jgi:homoserine O-succinyltransferase
MPDAAPHSRLNGLDPAELAASGYEIVSCSAEAGVDTFVLRRRALFVFYQGHPEYDRSALFREYRRDVNRFLAGSMERYPEMPSGYFDDETSRALEAFRARAERRRKRELRSVFPEIHACENLAPVWHDVGVRLYRNWLRALGERRSDESLTTVGASPGRSP